MKISFERNIHVLNQLLGYCRKIGGEEIESKLLFKDEQTSIIVSAPIKSLSEQALSDLRKHLEMPRQPEVEENYWNIGLSGNLGDELSLVGMMIDWYSAVHEEGVLTISVRRKNNVSL